MAGQPVALTATVASTTGGATPTGMVTFTNTTTGETLGTVDLVDGIATLIVSNLPVGMNMIVAAFVGNPNAAASTSAPATVTVTATPALGNGSAFGAGSGGGQVILRGPDGAVLPNIAPFGTDFTGGVRVASGDFNGDGVIDLVVGTGRARPVRSRSSTARPAG